VITGAARASAGHCAAVCSGRRKGVVSGRELKGVQVVADEIKAAGGQA